MPVASDGGANVAAAVQDSPGASQVGAGAGVDGEVARVVATGDGQPDPVGPRLARVRDHHVDRRGLGAGRGVVEADVALVEHEVSRTDAHGRARGQGAGAGSGTRRRTDPDVVTALDRGAGCDLLDLEGDAVTGREGGDADRTEPVGELRPGVTVDGDQGHVRRAGGRAVAADVARPEARADRGPVRRGLRGRGHVVEPHGRAVGRGGGRGGQRAEGGDRREGDED